MIPGAFITEWKANAPWKNPYMVEQDLIISRGLVEIFSDSFLSEHLVFRGGTALHKLHLPMAARYSEDIDLVQIKSGPIGPIFDRLRKIFEPLFGKTGREFGPGVVSLRYKTQSEIPPTVKLKLKIEINAREHFALMGIKDRQYSVHSKWFTGNCMVKTYAIEELLGTKLRALYQRRKGRDIFDIWLAVTAGNADPEKVVMCFRQYMEKSGLTVSETEFRMNLDGKIYDPNFKGDLNNLLREDFEFDFNDAVNILDRKILPLLRKKHS